MSRINQKLSRPDVMVWGITDFSDRNEVGREIRVTEKDKN